MEKKKLQKYIFHLSFIINIPLLSKKFKICNMKYLSILIMNYKKKLIIIRCILCINCVTNNMFYKWIIVSTLIITKLIHLECDNINFNVVK